MKPKLSDDSMEVGVEISEATVDGILAGDILEEAEIDVLDVDTKIEVATRLVVVTTAEMAAWTPPAPSVGIGTSCPVSFSVFHTKCVHRL
jgi:hypothetical protein